MSRADRLAAEFLARQVRDLMDMGSPRNTPFDSWLADYFMRFLAERGTETRRLALEEAAKIAWPIEPGLMYIGCLSDGKSSSCSPACHKRVHDAIRALKGRA